MSERMEYQTGLWATIVRELKQLVSRPIYVLCMVGAPLFSCIFLLSLMHEGLPHKIPVALTITTTPLRLGILFNSLDLRSRSMLPIS